MSNALVQMIANLEDNNAVQEVKRQLNANVDPNEIFSVCQEGMVEVGKKFQSGEFFISDLMMAASIFKDINELVTPYLKSSTGTKSGKVVIGTVEGDIHDIGKDIVISMLNAGNFEVVDLGVDVKPETFVNALKENGAKVLGLSCLLTTAYDSLKKTVEAVEAAGLRDQVKIIIGGGPVDQGVVKYTGADAFGSDAQDAVRLCREVM